MKNNTLVFLGFVFICLINISANKPKVHSSPVAVPVTKKVPDAADARSASLSDSVPLTDHTDQTPHAGPSLR